eukprot:338954-Amphidinium_carterae.1
MHLGVQVTLGLAQLVQSLIHEGVGANYVCTSCGEIYQLILSDSFTKIHHRPNLCEARQQLGLISMTDGCND